MATTESTGKSVVGTATDESETTTRTTLAKIATTGLSVENLVEWDAWRAAAEATQDTLERESPGV